MLNVMFFFRFGLFGVTAEIPDNLVLNYIGVVLAAVRYQRLFLIFSFGQVCQISNISFLYELTES